MNFSKRYGNLSMAIATSNSYRNKGFPNEPDVGYRNFFIPRVEKTSKNEPAGRKSLPPKGRRPAGGELFCGPWEVSFFFPRAYFKVSYNPRDEDISIPDINGHSENLFLFEFIYVQNLFFFREIVMRTRHPGGNVVFRDEDNFCKAFAGAQVNLSLIHI